MNSFGADFAFTDMAQEHSDIFPSSAVHFQPNSETESIKCSRCRWGGCDVKISSCGCSYHARCMPLQIKSILTHCPTCNVKVSGLSLYPMAFDEIDEATKQSELSKSNKRVRKRKSSIISVDESSGSSSNNPDGKQAKSRKRSFDDPRDNKDSGNCRTGRWTLEEIEFCDKLVNLFKDGMLPLAQGIKLNDFLASMLKSKQSRLTKKMKNAKLSSKIFQGTDCFITEISECTDFSQVEDKFLHAIPDAKERALLKFHMQKEWRETFSSFCLQIGQPVDADAWLSSVEEMDRRVSMAKDASRILRRKLMTGYALCEDFKAAPPGVYIERTKAEIAAAENNEPLSFKHSNDAILNLAETDEVLQLLDGDFNDKAAAADLNTSLDFNNEGLEDFDMIGKSSVLHASPFLNKVMAYIKRHNVPFEHVDVWVPNAGNDTGVGNTLGFAGCATSDIQLTSSSDKGPAVPLDPEDKFNFLAFGDYSQKFSFADGYGLPGSVFRSGIPVWEETLSTQSFERVGGAHQWGVRSCVGIPIPSPNVGRIVICLYSGHERTRDDALVQRLQEEFAKLLPTPKWKLIIDMSSVSHGFSKSSDPAKSSFPLVSSSKNISDVVDPRTSNTVKNNSVLSEIINLLGEELTSNMSVASSEVHNLTGLRLFLLKASRTSQEKDVANTLFGSYSSYARCGRSNSEIAAMLCRDFVFLTQEQQVQMKPQQPLSEYPQYCYGDAQQNSYYRHSNYLNNNQQQYSQSYGSTNVNSFVTDYKHAFHASFNDGTAATDTFATSGLSMPYYPIQDGPGLDPYRSSSPALSPIGPQSGGDNLSVVSH